MSPLRPSSKILSALGVCLGAGLLFLQAASQSVAQTQASLALEVLRALEQARIDIFQKAAPSVVILEVEIQQDLSDADPELQEPGAGPKGRPESRGPLRSEGSGFVVRSNGIIATNLHVVAQARRIGVKMQDGRRFDAHILGSDERTDVAVIQVDNVQLPALGFADSDLATVGQFVCAIGVPFGQEWSFTSGMLSGKGRSRLLAPSSSVPLYEDYLQTDAVINPGHSGGPLLDSNGKVLGMNTLIARQEKGMAFAVPSNLLQQTVNQIVESGKVSRPWLGVRVETLGETPALMTRLGGAKTGVVVLAVEADGPAFKTDLRPADVIQSLDDKPVSSAIEMQRRLFDLKAGQFVRVGIWRQGATKSFQIQLAELPGIPQVVVSPDRGKNVPPQANERFGLTLKEVKGRGLKVEAIADGSSAFFSELQKHDLITEVESRQVRSINDCISALRSALGRPGGGGALLQVEREGRRIFVILRNN